MYTKKKAFNSYIVRNCLSGYVKNNGRPQHKLIPIKRGRGIYKLNFKFGYGGLALHWPHVWEKKGYIYTLL